MLGKMILNGVLWVRSCILERRVFKQGVFFRVYIWVSIGNNINIWIKFLSCNVIS